MYLWRPCTSEPPLCTFADLKSGRITLNELADMHEYLDLKEEYLRRVRAKEDEDRKS